MVLLMTTLITLIALSSSFSAPLNEKRLIELGDGSRSWMTQEQITKLTEKFHAQGKCGGFFDVTDHPEPAVQPHEALFNPALISSSFFERNLTQKTTVEKLLNQISDDQRMKNLETNVHKLSTLFPHRKHHTQEGKQAALWLEDQLRKLADGRPHIEIERFNHNWEQPSIITRIQGSEFPKEKVILGGHLDSIAGFFGKTAPGADDNASGISVLVETLRTLVQSDYRPKRTIEFIAYAGEERGLLGSQAIAARYKNQGQSVVAVMQFDMTMFEAQARQLTLITDHTDPGLNAFVQKLLKEYVKVSWSTSQCGYPCSDHASWTRNGYPSVFPFEAPFGKHNPNIHTTKDTLSKISLAHGLHFTKLGIAFAVELGSGQ